MDCYSSRESELRKPAFSIRAPFFRPLEHRHCRCSPSSYTPGTSCCCGLHPVPVFARPQGLLPPFEAGDGTFAVSGSVCPGCSVHGFRPDDDWYFERKRQVEPWGRGRRPLSHPLGSGCTSSIWSFPAHSAIMGAALNAGLIWKTCLVRHHCKWRLRRVRWTAAVAELLHGLLQFQGDRASKVRRRYRRTEGQGRGGLDGEPLVATDSGARRRTAYGTDASLRGGSGAVGARPFGSQAKGYPYWKKRRNQVRTMPCGWCKLVSYGHMMVIPGKVICFVRRTKGKISICEKTKPLVCITRVLSKIQHENKVSLLSTYWLSIHVGC